MNDLRSSYRQKEHMNAALTVCKRPSEVSGQLNLKKGGGGEIIEVNVSFLGLSTV